MRLQQRWDTCVAVSKTPFVRHRLEGDGTNTPLEGHGTVEVLVLVADIKKGAGGTPPTPT